mgnify:CR=1 FL=1
MLRRFRVSFAALAMACVLAALPVDGAIASVRGPEPAAAREPSPVPPGELTAEHVERVAPDIDLAPVKGVEYPVGDFSAQAEAVASAPQPVTLAPMPLGQGSEDLAAEVADLPVVDRDEYSNTFGRADGSRIRQTFTEPVNVEVEGKWEPTSTTLER